MKVVKESSITMWPRCKSSVLRKPGEKLEPFPWCWRGSLVSYSGHLGQDANIALESAKILHWFLSACDLKLLAQIPEGPCAEMMLTVYHFFMCEYCQQTVK